MKKTQKYLTFKMNYLIYGLILARKAEEESFRGSFMGAFSLFSINTKFLIFSGANQI